MKKYLLLITFFLFSSKSLSQHIDPFLFEVINVGPPIGATLQDDGKIVVIRSVEFDNNDLDFGIVRLNSDGNLDTTFGLEGKNSAFVGPTGVPDVPTDLAIQADGKIVVVGPTGTGDFIDFGIARFNTNGSFDSSFGFSGFFGTHVEFNQGGDDPENPIGADIPTGVALQSDGKIIVIGSVDVGNGNLNFGIARLTSDGSSDRSFGFEGQARIAFDQDGANVGAPTGVAIQTDGKIIIVGPVDMGNGDLDYGIVRLNTDGSLDQSFGVDGRSVVAFNQGGANVDLPSDVVVQSDGKIILIGSVDFGNGDLDFGVVRLNSDGSLDQSFGTNGGTTTAFDLGESTLICR